jgi:hypothetical protein
MGEMFKELLRLVITQWLQPLYLRFDFYSRFLCSRCVFALTEGLSMRCNKDFQSANGLSKPIQELAASAGEEIRRVKEGLDHGVGHPGCLYARQKASNHLWNRAFNNSDYDPEWPKVADAVIKASKKS